MNKIIKYTALTLVLGIGQIYAQGPTRAGQAGFTQLLINGWGRSSGMGNSYSSGVHGVEAFHLNIAGLGRVQGTELAFSRTSWLGGTGININTFGYGQRIGDGAIGISMMSFSIGQIPITTVSQPDGGIGTYKPSISNINLGYAYNFTTQISAGINVKLISESTPDVRTSGMAFDAGLQYATQLIKDKNKMKTKYLSDNPAAKRESDIRFGVSIKNLGADLKYSGDGLATKSTLTDKNYVTTTSQRADKTQLPSLINVGLAYDFRLDKKAGLYWHRLTTAMNFTNNSFSSNQTSLGVEYAYKEILMLRSAFDYEKGIFNYDTRRTAYTGLCLGASVQIPLAKKDVTNGKRENDNAIAVDYSYRSTNPFSGTHTFGVRITID